MHVNRLTYRYFKVKQFLESLFVLYRIIIEVSESIKTDSAQRSSNKCKKYLPKNYS